MRPLIVNSFIFFQKRNAQHSEVLRKIKIASYVCFSAAAGEVEVEGDPQVFEGLQVVSEALPGKLPQSVLVPLSRLLHLAFLEDTLRHKQGERDQEGGSGPNTRTPDCHLVRLTEMLIDKPTGVKTCPRNLGAFQSLTRKNV